MSHSSSDAQYQACRMGFMLRVARSAQEQNSRKAFDRFRLSDRLALPMPQWVRAGSWRGKASVDSRQDLAGTLGWVRLNVEKQIEYATG